ncbi:MAG: class B sortase [Parasporobacterium sp.]|nr:class B sortase [Parasporobacterium sp.]
MKKQKKKMSKGFKAAIIIILVVAVGLIGFSVYKLVQIDNSYDEANDLYAEIEELVVTPRKASVKLAPEQEITEQVPDGALKEQAGEKAQVIYTPGEPVQIIGGTHPADPAWAVYPSGEEAEKTEQTSYMFRFASLSLNFDALLGLCEDSVGWIYQEDIMSYPVVQGEDNNQYLRNMINGKYNVAGTLFVDSRFPKGLKGRYSTIYGHNMDDKSMFGSITSYKNEEYYKEHPTFEIFIEDQAYLYQVYAAAQIKIESDLFSTFEADDEQFQVLIDEIDRIAGRTEDGKDPKKKPADEKKEPVTVDAASVIGNEEAFEDGTAAAAGKKDNDSADDEDKGVMTYKTIARELNKDSHVIMLVTCIDYPRDYAYRYVVLLERDGKLYDPALLDLFESDEKADDTEKETTVSKQK